MPSVARADFDFARVREALQRRTIPAQLANARGERVALVLERRDADATLPAGAIPIANRFYSLTLSREQAASALLEPGFVAHWAPERHLLLDRALGWARVPQFRAAASDAASGSGRGVVIGLVDTGIALEHPDFFDAQGRSRVRWLIDFTRPPAGLPGGAALEAALGCAGERECAVYSATDLATLLNNAVVGDEPRDTVGHGTHVASLAASNGRSSPERTYAGVAPEADLVVARVTDGQSGISDPVILDAVSFVFERARELGAPAVVNLSLGSDLGAHDGSSALERALASLVGADQPGRAIVVAAGNSGGLFRGLRNDYPSPLGVHTEVHVPRDSSTTVALLTPRREAAITKGRMTVWMAFQPEDELSISVERSGRQLGATVESGSAAQLSAGDLEVLALNGTGAAGTQVLAQNAAIVLIDGEWKSGETFGLRFEGRGTASLWVEGAGDVDPAVSPGPLFPLAQKDGTINVPATSPDLIAVGATFNRGDWVDAKGIRISRPMNGALSDSPADTISYFSSGGPNAIGGMKPDIVAPGTNVIGAMAAFADPRVNPGSMFSGAGVCGSVGECLVVDEFHALATGTSMASPLVAGVVALLLERDRSLTQPQIRALLQAGARKLEGAESFEPQVGPGALDAHGALEALLQTAAHERLPGSGSWLSLAAAYAHPDPTWPLQGLAELRNDAGQLADGFDARRLSLAVERALVLEPLQRVAPGMYRFTLAAPAGSGGSNLEVRLRFDGMTITSRTLPIAVDRGALVGLAVPRAGCAFGASKPRGLDWTLLALLALANRLRRRGRA